MTTIQNLPTGIIEDIISRLPSEKVLDCKLVCKNWKSIIRTHSSFGHKHLKNHLLVQKYYPSTDDVDKKGENQVSSSKISFIAHRIEQIDDDLSDHHTLLYKEYDEEVITSKQFNRFFSSLLADGATPIGSCDGLICLEDLSISICNPITKECVYLPELTTFEYGNYGIISCGFGYSALPKRYKVVRLLSKSGENLDDCLRLIQVYTLGSEGRWRDKDTVPHMINFDPHAIISDPGVFVDGSLCWLDMEGNILAFDLSTEKFTSLTKLPFDHEEDNPQRHQSLTVLGGWLSVVDFFPTRIDVWFFSKSRKEQEFMSWTKVFSFVRDTSSIMPIALTNLGEVICYTNQGHLRLYGDGEGYSTLEVTHPYRHGIMHLNSFVSLGFLGQQHVNVIGEEAVGVQ